MSDDLHVAQDRVRERSKFRRSCYRCRCEIQPSMTHWLVYKALSGRYICEECEPHVA